jgi:hypothetical protein
MLAPRHYRRAAALGALLLMALAGCSSTNSAEPSSAPMNGGVTEGAAPDKALPPGAVGAPEAGDTQTAPGPRGEAAPAPVDERSLIYTGNITVKVDGVSAAADRAKSLTVGLGGLVTGDSRTLDGDRSQATLILRVPADQFNSALDSLAKLGTEETRQVQAQDVTDQLIDLNVRVATQEASVSRVRDLLARAQTIGEIVTLESELTRRQADLDSLKQRREKLAGLVALATITVVLHAPAATGLPKDPETGFLAGLKDGWDGFLASVKIVLTVAGWLLPWVVAIGVPAWVAIWLTRRRRHAAVVPPPPAAPTEE